ncbi:MAG: 1-acyl-sn-glycerol-3-phosphate acyltransferase [Phycisphaerales bacterium]|nr:MAG: 1-acyl-sn-glycerol-3-phosphate acyltransferase [Phycisphaerales bacterium]
MLRERLSTAWFWLARWICRVLCILFFRLRTSGKENVPESGAFVLASNHQSYLDPVLCGVPLKRQLFFLARDSLFSNWFFGRLLSSVKAMPVKRDGGDLATMRKIIGKLKEGSGVCLFPEGTRSSDGRIAPFKPGFGLLCRRGKAGVVPVLIDGSFECWPRHRKLFSRGAITVCYGRAITAKQVEGMKDDELAKLVADTLRKMQNDRRLKQGKEPYEY